MLNKSFVTHQNLYKQHKSFAKDYFITQFCNTLNNNTLLYSTIFKKASMAISGLFLIIFLLQHFAINITSVFSGDLFNQLSHFMGTNPLVQFVLQPILIFGVIFHFVMGFVLDIINKRARGRRYKIYKGNSNASWVSRNMIISGSTVLAFLVLHFYDFWIPEMDYKYVKFLPAKS